MSKASKPPVEWTVGDILFMVFVVMPALGVIGLIVIAIIATALGG